MFIINWLLFQIFPAKSGANIQNLLQSYFSYLFHFEINSDCSIFVFYFLFKWSGKKLYSIII